MALTDKLSAIGDAIREKTGGTELMTLDAMPAAIAGIQTGGGGGDLPEEAFVISSHCAYRFYGGGWDWFINTYGDRITTKDISGCAQMFQNSNIETIPFTFNCNQLDGITNMFDGCSNLKEVPSIDFQMGWTRPANYLFSRCHSLEKIGTLKNMKIDSASYMFNDCFSLKAPPTFENLDNTELINGSWKSANYLFYNCHKLNVNDLGRTLKLFINPNSTSSYSSFYKNTLSYCFSLPAVDGFPVMNTVAFTSNMFGDTFISCARLKELRFQTGDGGVPLVAQWKNQIIDLSSNVGFALAATTILNNTDFTEETRITDIDSYDALVHNADSWTTDPEYSRYDKQSAVHTMQTLPDTSAYLATAGGTNTIKFTSVAGCRQRGTKISDLTEEEIAVATAKGWTVTFV